jgi:single-stranded DNA-binding protein
MEIECAFIAGVGSDVDIRTSQASKPWASFIVCVGDKNDEQQQWLQVAVFGDKANSIALGKGDRCYIEASRAALSLRVGPARTAWSARACRSRPA